MDHSDSQIKSIFRRRNHDFFAVYKYLSFIREINTRQHIHQCGLTASVFTQKRQDLSFSYGQINTVIGNDFFTKTFCNIF